MQIQWHLNVRQPEAMDWIKWHIHINYTIIWMIKLLIVQSTTMMSAWFHRSTSNRMR